jgi:hypothetical protein
MFFKKFSLIFLPVVLLMLVFTLEAQAADPNHATVVTDCPTSNPAGTSECVSGKHYVNNLCRLDGDVNTGLIKDINACKNNKLPAPYPTYRTYEDFSCTTGQCVCEVGTRDCRGATNADVRYNRCLPANLPYRGNIDSKGAQFCTSLNRAFDQCTLVTNSSQCGACLSGFEEVDGTCLSLGEVNQRVVGVDSRVVILEETPICQFIDGQLVDDKGSPCTSDLATQLGELQTAFISLSNVLNSLFPAGTNISTYIQNIIDGTDIQQNITNLTTIINDGVGAEATSLANGAINSLDDFGDFGITCADGDVIKYGGAGIWTCAPASAAAGLWEKNGVDVYYSAGKVGVGTDTPTEPLDVRGIIRNKQGFNYDVWIQGGIGLGGDGRNLALLGQSSVDKLFLNPFNEYDAGTIIGSKVGIGTSDIQAQLTLKAGTGISSDTVDGSDISYLQFDGGGGASGGGMTRGGNIGLYGNQWGGNTAFKGSVNIQAGDAAETGASGGNIMFSTGDNEEHMRITNAGTTWFTKGIRNGFTTGTVYINKDSSGFGETDLHLGNSGRLAGESSKFRVGGKGVDLALTGGADGKTDYVIVKNDTGNVNFNGDITLSGGDLDFVKGQTSRIHSLGNISFDWTAGGTYDSPANHGIASTNESATWSDNLSINSYNSIVNRLDSNNNNATSYFKVEHNSTGNGEDLMSVESPSGDVRIKGRLYGELPIYTVTGGTRTLAAGSRGFPIWDVAASCDAGDEAISGGCLAAPASFTAWNDSDLVLRSSYRIFDAWVCDFARRSSVGSRDASAWVSCLDHDGNHSY